MRRTPLRSTIALLALAAACAPAGAQISLDMAPTAPGSSDVLLHWESDSPGPFSLLARDVPGGERPVASLPLDLVADLVASSITSPHVLVGAADRTRPLGATIYQVVDGSGGCSNVGSVVRVATTSSAGSDCIASFLALPWRSVYIDTRAVLDWLPSVQAVRVLDGDACRNVVLRRLPAGGYEGENALVPPGRGIEVAWGIEPVLVLVGASDPSARPMRKADSACTRIRELLSLPVAEPEENSVELLCGLGTWDGSGFPEDDCLNGFNAGEASTAVGLPPHEGVDSWTWQSVTWSTTMSRWTFTDTTFTPVPGVPIALEDSAHGSPRLDYAPADSGSIPSCRCGDADGDGADDCSERLRGTDPLDALDGAPDADGDGVPDSVDSCPTESDPAQPDGDGDGRGDACDPCPTDVADACVDADADGTPSARDNCAATSNAGQQDVDFDSVGDACDNCALVPNPCQEDSAPIDGIGDACSDDSDPSCCAPEVLHRTAWSTQQTWPVLGADDSGNVIVALNDGTGSVWASHDDGTTWTRALNAGSGVGRFAGVVSRDGHVVIAWLGLTGRVNVASSSDGGRTFSPSTDAGDASGAFAFKAGMGPTGLASLVWATPSTLAVAMSDDWGSSWGPAQSPAGWTPGSGQGEPAVVVTDATCVVGWIGEDAGGAPIPVVVRSTDVGASWSPPIAIGGPARAPLLLSTSLGGKVQSAVGYRDASAVWSIRTNLSVDDGATWGLEAVTPSDGPPSSLVARPDGVVRHLVLDASYRLSMRGSDAHGAAGTWWPLPTEVSPASRLVDVGWIVLGDGAIVDVLHADYRQGAPLETVNVARSCDGGRSFAYFERRIDVPRDMGHSEPDYPPVRGRDGRLHAIWFDLDLFRIVHATTRAPDLATLRDSGPACATGPHRLELEPGDVEGCPGLVVEWLLDGVVVPGETGLALDVPSLPPGSHDFEARVSCGGRPRCGGTVSIAISVPGNHAVLGTNVDGVLRVAKSAPGLLVTWQDRATAPTGYSLYAGTVASLFLGRSYDHASLACHVPRPSGGALDTSLEVAMPPDDTYYLVAPADCEDEGLVGSSSLGILRPVAGSGVECGPMP